VGIDSFCLICVDFCFLQRQYVDVLVDHGFFYVGYFFSVERVDVLSG